VLFWDFEGMATKKIWTYPAFLTYSMPSLPISVHRLTYQCWTSKCTQDERLIEGIAKCPHLKKLTCKGTLRQVFICLRPRTPYPSPPYTLSTCIQYHYSHREGGEVEPERRGEVQQFTKLGRKYQHDWLYLQSIKSDKHLFKSIF